MLAKSPPTDPARQALTLEQHAEDTEVAAERLFRPGTRWSRNLCRFFGLADPERFLLNLRVAALFHDMGKANEDFQQAVTTHRGLTQALRHEHLSALILCLPEVRAWLGHNPGLDADAITAAVLSHHLKAAAEGEHAWCQPRGKLVLTLLLAHPQVTAILERVRAVAALPARPMLPPDRWSDAPPWSTAWEQGMQSATQFRRSLKRDDARCALTLALKVGVIAADSAASGLVRTGQSIPGWIEEVAHVDRLTAHALRQNIIERRCASLNKPGKPFGFHTFQDRAAELGPRALLLAGCGSGKTLAAWRWAETQLAAFELGHVIFLYPTRGTATEGFRDYVAWAPEDEAALVHGTAGYELEGMAHNPSEAMGDKRFELDETERRLFALGLWRRRYFSATVDQFLSFLEHRYESLCLLPLLADSAVILDEVHSYDRAMFNNLMAFLQKFDVPVLCMTATLSPSRRRQLEQNAGLRVYPTEAERSELDDLERAESHPRYCIELVASSELALERAVAAYRGGSRVLWVVNTVQRCQELARNLASLLGMPVLAYHSRFCLRDRQARHQATIEAFQQRDAPAIAITTQVCEMSLDLDADVLVSELAPVSSLVQRLGRANRHLARGPEFRAAVYLYVPASPAPYTKDDLASARAFVDDLRASGVLTSTSQKHLAEALERHALDEPLAHGSARFLEGGYFAVPGDFREGDDFGATCVLDSDLARLALLTGDSDWRERHLPGYLLSVPRKHVLRDVVRPEWLPAYIQLAPGRLYHADLGFLVGDAP